MGAGVDWVSAVLALGAGMGMGDGWTSVAPTRGTGKGAGKNAERYLPAEWYRDWLGPNGTVNRSRLRDRSWDWETGLGMETG